jgi:hypothetical protein
MPITPFLKNQAFDPQLVQAMSLAYQRACERLRLTETADIATEVIASKIIRMAQQGERDPDRLCRRVLQELDVKD